MNPKDRITYTDQERQDKIDALVKSISYGLSFKQACELVGINYNTGNRWQRDYPDFRDRVQAAKVSNVEDLSAKMHTLAKAGNYQALAFLLSKSPESPFKDGKILLTDSEIDAMEQLMNFLCEQGGLLPTQTSFFNLNQLAKREN